MYVLALSDISRCSKPAAAAGYKPAPQLGRQIAVYQEVIKKACQQVLASFLIGCVVCLLPNVFTVG